jgi:hypothetical protein
LKQPPEAVNFLQGKAEKLVWKVNVGYGWTWASHLSNLEIKVKQENNEIS